MPALNTTQLIRWSCPANLHASPPLPDADGSMTLMHVIDAAGNDFKIRCIRGALSFHYEYSVSFPDGTVKEISQCIYPLGLNNATLVYQGPMSETTAPNGTPIINVGSILVVEHSNVEATGFALAGNLTPKPGGSDFHMLYDYRNRFRFRVNTVVGRGGISMDLLASRANTPPHAILHADVTLVRSLPSFKRALAGDTAFRKIDDPAATPPGEYVFQDANTDDVPIGYVYIDGDERRSGGILLDPGLRGSSFALRPFGLEGRVPAASDRVQGTFAVERRLFRNKGEVLAVTVDGKPARKPQFRGTETMVVVDVPLDERAHTLQLVERKPPRKGSGRPKAAPRPRARPR